MRYCAYLRKSRADMEAEARGEGETLARHRRILSDIAAGNSHRIGQWYQEIVSGDTISTRPEMRRLLADVGAGFWAGVYVMEIERLARGETLDQGLVAQAFKYSNTSIITPAKTYDPGNEFDEEYFEFSLFMSRREFKTINRRIQAGRMQSLREGKYICSRPAYGYRRVKIPGEKGYTLAIEEAEAAVIRQIFGWYLHGCQGQDMGLARIAGRLHDLRVPAGEQGNGWSPCRVQRILSNEVYIGKIRWGRAQTEKTLAQGTVSKRVVTRDDYQLFDGRHEPIIDEATFRAVQEKRAGRGNVPVRRDHEISNPLAGLLACAACGHRMRALPPCGRQPAVVFCATRGCPTVRAYRGPVEAAILSALRPWLEGYMANIQTRPEPPQPPPGIETAARLRLANERETVIGQRDRLHDLLEQGVYSPAVFAERLAVISQRLMEIGAALRPPNGQRPMDQAAERPAPTLRHVLDLYDAARNPREQNTFLRAAIWKIEYAKHRRGHARGGIAADQFTLTIYPRLAPPTKQ